MLCFSVDSPDSLENIETKWKSEIEENCPGVKLVLVALKCDLREKSQDDEDEPHEPKRPNIEYKQGLQVAQRIKALRYLGRQLLDYSGIDEQANNLVTECSAMKNRGVNEAFTEAARVALSVKNTTDKSSSCTVM